MNEAPANRHACLHWWKPGYFEKIPKAEKGGGSNRTPLSDANVEIDELRMNMHRTLYSHKNRPFTFIVKKTCKSKPATSKCISHKLNPTFKNPTFHFHHSFMQESINIISQQMNGCFDQWKSITFYSHFKKIILHCKNKQAPTNCTKNN